MFILNDIDMMLNNKFVEEGIAPSDAFIEIV